MEPRAEAPEADIAAMQSEFAKANCVMLISLDLGLSDVGCFVHRSAKRAGDYQVTFLAESEPIGDWQADSLETALYIARECNFGLKNQAA